MLIPPDAVPATCRVVNRTWRNSPTASTGDALARAVNGPTEGAHRGLGARPACTAEEIRWRARCRRTVKVRAEQPATASAWVGVSPSQATSSRASRSTRCRSAEAAAKRPAPRHRVRVRRSAPTGCGPPRTRPRRGGRTRHTPGSVALRRGSRHEVSWDLSGSRSKHRRSGTSPCGRGTGGVDSGRSQAGRTYRNGPGGRRSESQEVAT